MPITSTWTTSGKLAGNGITTAFSYGQPIQSIYDLSVFLIDNNGVSYPPLISGIDYQTNGVGNPSSGAWTITYPLNPALVPLPTSWFITINLQVPLVTNSNITVINTNSGPVIQTAIDRCTLQELSIQQEINTLGSSLAAGTVLSVNGNTGAVTITPANIAAAPLNSPGLTGTPTAPTATPGTNTTQIATTAFIAASYAPLASPALTGTPTVPSATTGTNTTQAASTAFVQAQVASTLASPPAIGSTAPAAVTATTIKFNSAINPTNQVPNNGSNSTQALSTNTILGNGCFVQASGNSTWTLPTGTAMDTAVGAGVSIGMLITFTATNAGSGTITISANTGFALSASYTIGPSVGATFQAYRTNTANLWQLFKVSA